MLSERRLKAELEKRGDKKLADRDKLAEQFTKSIVNDSNLEQYGDDIVKYMADLYELPEESAPCWIVHRALDRHRNYEGTVQGSSLYDESYIWLSMYCDLTIVDRGTKDNNERAARKDEDFNNLVGRIERTPTQEQLLQLLDEEQAAETYT